MLSCGYALRSEVGVQGLLAQTLIGLGLWSTNKTIDLTLETFPSFTVSNMILNKTRAVPSVHAVEPLMSSPRWNDFLLQQSNLIFSSRRLECQLEEIPDFSTTLDCN